MTDRRANPFRQTLEQKGLYHSFRLPDGRVLDGMHPLASLEQRLDAFGIPHDLTGLRVLDIGPWDGYCTFELERRGAQVTAIDYVDLDTFRLLHRAFDSHADYLRLDVYQLDPKVHGTFDIVLCFGVLYHLKHPLLALERICGVTRGVCHVDSFCIDPAEHFAGHRPAHPYAEFYPHDEFAGQLDNWTGPTVSQLEAWLTTAGFAYTEARGHTGTTALLSAHRRWQLPPPTRPPLEVATVSSHRHRGNTFYSAQEEYVCVWCYWEGDTPDLSQLHPEVDGLGVAPLHCHATGQALSVSFPLPPGLEPGRHEVRLRIQETDWSAPHEIFVDLPPWTAPVELLSAQDGISYEPSVVSSRWLTVWCRGLSPLAGEGNTLVHVNDVPHDPDKLLWRPVEQAWQINVHLRACVRVGEYDVSLTHRGAASNAVRIAVTTDGTMPRGLDSL